MNDFRLPITILTGKYLFDIGSCPTTLDKIYTVLVFMLTWAIWLSMAGIFGVVNETIILVIGYGLGAKFGDDS